MTDRPRDELRDDGCLPQDPPVKPLTLPEYPDRLNLRGDKCDPQGDPVDDVFYEPDGALETPVTPRGTPPLLPIVNPAVTVSCSGVGQVPNSVTVEAGEVVEFFDWRTIPELTEDRLRYLSELYDGELEDILSWAAQDFEDVQAIIRSTYKLTRAQALFVWETVGELQDRVLDLATVTAEGALECWWENVEITVNCSTAGNGGVGSITVPAGEFRSEVSQEDANTRAELYGQAQVICTFYNQEVTVTCLGDLGFPEAVPGTEVTPTAFGQVGSYTVPQGVADFAVVGGYNSDLVESARELALAHALAQLRCFYVNDEVSTSCAQEYPAFMRVVGAGTEEVNGYYQRTGEENGRPLYSKGDIRILWSTSDNEWVIRDTVLEDNYYMGTDDVPTPDLSGGWIDESLGSYPLPQVTAYGTSGSTPADPATGTLGQTVTIPPGFIESITGTDDANTQAQALAESLLDCYWENPAIEVSCPSWETGNPVTSPCSLPSLYKVDIPAADFRSYVSPEDAEEQARLYGETLLICIFYNEEECGTCSDPGVLPPHVTTPVAFARVCFRDSGPYDGEDVMPPLAGTYFVVPTSAGTRQVTFQYTGVPGGLDVPGPVAGSDVTISVPFNTAGNTGTSIAGLVRLALPDAYAEFQNDPSWVYGEDCGDFPVPEWGGYACVYLYNMGVDPDPNVLSSGSAPVSVYFQGAYTDPDHPSARARVSTPACTVSSVVSQEDANEQAIVLAQAQLLCLWGNTEVDGGYTTGDGEPGVGVLRGASIPAECESGVAFSNPGVSANTLSGNAGKWEVNNRAKTLASALVTCRNSNVQIIRKKWVLSTRVINIVVPTDDGQMRTVTVDLGDEIDLNDPSITRGRKRVTILVDSFDESSGPWKYILPGSVGTPGVSVGLTNVPIGDPIPDPELNIDYDGAGELQVDFEITVEESVVSTTDSLEGDLETRTITWGVPGGSVSLHPWKVTRADDGEIKRIRVHPGAIDGLMPTNMFSHFTISGSGVEYLVLSVLASSGTLVSCSLSVEAAQPSVPVSTEDSPPDTLYDVIAVLHDGQIYQVRSRNLSATSQLVAEVPALIAEPWRDNLKRFYRWGIEEAV